MTEFSCVQSDAIQFLSAQVDDSIDLLFTSPPYEDCRTYGIDFRVKGEDWVKWMVDLVTVASPKVKGLIAINCEGKTSDFRYSCVPFLLAADLHRAGFNLRKPVVFNRVGIPGSGGDEWLRNDWEPIICITRPGRLPWADNTACGHKPKYGPGGEMSHRMRNGSRVNGKMIYKVTSTDGYKNGDTLTKKGDYSPPDTANPGNVVRLDAGGGRMGHKSAHRNEAPFPLKLAEFFVKSFCPPSGLVCDPFSGSGTVAQACKENGRRFTGCDIRQSQVDLTLARLRSVTPGMFNSENLLAQNGKS